MGGEANPQLDRAGRKGGGAVSGEEILGQLSRVEARLREVAIEQGRGARALALSAIATQVYLARAALAGLMGTGPERPAGVE